MIIGLEYSQSEYDIGQFSSSIKLPLADEEPEQYITFPVRVIPECEGDFRLVTGEKIYDIEGCIKVSRGRKMMEDGDYFPDVIILNESFSGYDATFDATFNVQLFLPNSLFDQVVAFFKENNLPLIWLDFGHRRYNDPVFSSVENENFDGIIWNNNAYPVVNIESVSITFKMADTQKHNSDINELRQQINSLQQKLEDTERNKYQDSGLFGWLNRR